VSVTEGVLDGIVVVDLSRALAGPHAAMILGDLGARVIKVESPRGGDDSRGWGPPYVGDPADRLSTYFLSCNRNKESITLDLKDHADLEVLLRLVRRADVLIENFRPGVMDRLGLGLGAMRDLNPRLVICSITGFGHIGPEAQRAGYDQIAQGEAGLMSLTGTLGGSPTKVGVPIGDLLAGMNAVQGILAALYARTSTGRGTVVRTSLLASILSVHSFQGSMLSVGGVVPTRLGNQHPSIAPYGLYRAQDGDVQIAVGSEDLWARLTRLLGSAAEDARFATNTLRVQHREQLTALIESVFAGHRCSDLLRELETLGIPSGKVRTLDEVYAWDQVHALGLIAEVTDDLERRFSLVGHPVTYEAGPAAVRSVHQAPPRLGQHNESVRAWLASEEDGGRSGERSFQQSEQMVEEPCKR
jgi:crotonobetainyl-CoA:carnitine CoA-transferase CaiB-like acyl-CoA transferase